MISTNVMGIIFPNAHDQNIPEIVGHRTMASVPFGGRYRMIDFCLSSMSDAGIENIGVIVRKNYQSLMDHLGNGREWDLSRKRGGLTIFPPYAREGSKVYSGRIEGLHSVMDYLLHQKEELVLMSDCDIACNIDFAPLIAEHRKSGAEVTLVYEKTTIPETMRGDNITFMLDQHSNITSLRSNDYMPGEQNLSMNICLIGRNLLIDIVKDAVVRGYTRFERDFLARNLHLLKVRGYEFTGYRSRIFDMRSYFDENMRLLNPCNLEQLFPEERPVHTKVRDGAPVRYGMNASISNCLVADGCIVEGHVENSVLFRGVHVGRGTVLKNCIIMQGSIIQNDVQMEYVVTDKNVTVCSGQNLRGAASFPVFIAKGFKVT